MSSTAEKLPEEPIMHHSARYDAIATFYEQFAPDTYDDPPMAALLQLVGDVTRLRLLDLACGHGRLARELARRGSQVVGVDISLALLDIARADETREPLDISYLQANASDEPALEGETFDGVTCSFGLSDIDDLDGVIATVARVLRPEGFFALSILHPCFPGWEARQAQPSWSSEGGYYAEGWWRANSPAHGLRPKVGANHRMLSTYLNTFARHGLAVEEIVEPPPPPDWLAEPPTIGPVPVYFVARYRRAISSPKPLD
jgi:SAM-dependent methyltransferase